MLIKQKNRMEADDEVETKIWKLTEPRAIPGI